MTSFRFPRLTSFESTVPMPCLCNAYENCKSSAVAKLNCFRPHRYRAYSVLNVHEWPTKSTSWTCGQMHAKTLGDQLSEDCYECMPIAELRTRPMAENARDYQPSSSRRFWLQKRQDTTDQCARLSPNEKTPRSVQAISETAAVFQSVVLPFIPLSPALCFCPSLSWKTAGLSWTA